MKNVLINTDLSTVLRKVYTSKLLQQRGAGNPLLVSNFLGVVHFGLTSRRSFKKKKSYSIELFSNPLIQDVSNHKMQILNFYSNINLITMYIWFILQYTLNSKSIAINVFS